MRRHIALAVLLALSLSAAACGGRDETSAADADGAPPTAGAGSARTTLQGRIAFSNDVEDVYVMNADGSDLKRLTSNPAHDFDPA